MAGVNETPRQKMMGILYLVLLGLAATTVTDKVLDAFRNLSVGLETSTQNVETAINSTFDNFAATKLKEDAGRAKPLWDKASRVKAAANELDAEIAAIRAEFIKECGGFDSVAGDYKSREDVNIVPRYMMELRQNAKKLKEKIEDTKKRILAELGPGDAKNFKMALNADDPAPKQGIKTSWEQTYFGDGIPLTAAFTALSKISADLKNTESEAIKRILGSINQTDLTLDSYAAIAVPTSASYVFLGQQYSADVFLTAFSNTLNPEITVNGSGLKVEGGKGKFTVGASREGEFKWSATIRMKKNDGTMGEWKTPEQTYRVAKPFATVSPDAMLVFYIGVDNPITVSAPGIPLDKLKVSMTNGSISGSKGAYVVKPTASGEATVSIMGEDDSHKTIKLGETKFRVKRLPTPRAKFGGKSGGPIPKQQATSQDKLFANLEDFVFNAQFNINHFKIFIVKPRQDPQIFEASNNMLTAPMKAALSSMGSGTRIFFDEIFATGPDGIKRPLDPLIFTIQ